MLELLQERVTLFADFVEATGRGGAEEGELELSISSSKSSCSCRNLFRADTPHAPQAEPLLTSSIAEGEFHFQFSSERKHQTETETPPSVFQWTN